MYVRSHYLTLPESCYRPQITTNYSVFLLVISNPFRCEFKRTLKTKYVTSYVWRNKEVRSSSFVIFCPSVYYASPRFLKRQFIIFKRRIVVFCQLTSYKISGLFYFFDGWKIMKLIKCWIVWKYHNFVM